MPEAEEKSSAVAGNCNKESCVLCVRRLMRITAEWSPWFQTEGVTVLACSLTVWTSNSDGGPN